MKLQQIEQAAFIKLEHELTIARVGRGELALELKVSEGAHRQTALNMHKAKLEVSRLEHNAKAQNERVEWMARRMEAHVTELETLQGQLKVSKDAHEQTACQYMKSRQEAKRLHGELSERDHRLCVFVKDLAERTEELAQSKEQLCVFDQDLDECLEKLTQAKAQLEVSHTMRKRISFALDGARAESARRRKSLNTLGHQLAESHAERKALQKRLARALEYLQGTA